MAIRWKNLDRNVDYSVAGAQVQISAVASAGTVLEPIFTAPYQCRLHSVDLYFGNKHSASTLETLTLRVTAFSGGSATDALIAANTVASAGRYAQYRVSATANNNISQGTVIFIQFSAVCNVNGVSAVIVNTRFTPLDRGGNKLGPFGDR